MLLLDGLANMSDAGFMKCFFAAFISSAFLTLAISAEEKAVSLFNGKDLSGWKIKCLEKDKDKSFCSVKDGFILLDTKGQKDQSDVWLVHEQEFSDFELSVKIKPMREAKGNSGIQIRSRYGLNSKNIMWMHGPQIDVHPPAPFRTGLIYNATFEYRRWISPSKKSAGISPADTKHKVDWKKDDWNTLKVRAVGMRIQTWLNGNPVTDFDGTGILDDKIHAKHKVGKSGHIAFQIHGKQDMSLAFKDITIIDLAKQ